MKKIVLIMCVVAVSGFACNLTRSSLNNAIKQYNECIKKYHNCDKEEKEVEKYQKWLDWCIDDKQRQMQRKLDDIDRSLDKLKFGW